MHTDSTDCLLDDQLNLIPQELRIMFGNFVLSHVIEERMDEFNLTDPLTKPERRMLINLGVPRRMGQIAETMNALPSSVTAVADGLEKRGFLLRERDPDDRRAWQLRLTEQGETARRELIETIVATFRQITGLSDTDIVQLASVMDKMTENILKTGFPKGLSL